MEGGPGFSAEPHLGVNFCLCGGPDTRHAEPSEHKGNKCPLGREHVLQVASQRLLMKAGAQTPGREDSENW